MGPFANENTKGRSRFSIVDCVVDEVARVVLRQTQKENTSIEFLGRFAVQRKAKGPIERRKTEDENIILGR